jgi:hypothetical protein
MIAVQSNCTNLCLGESRLTVFTPLHPDIERLNILCRVHLMFTSGCRAMSLFLIRCDVPVNSVWSHKPMIDITPAMTFFAFFLIFSRRNFYWTRILRYKGKDYHGYQPHGIYILAIIFCRDIWRIYCFNISGKDPGKENSHPVGDWNSFHRNSNQDSEQFCSLFAWFSWYSGTLQETHFSVRNKFHKYVEWSMKIS